MKMKKVTLIALAALTIAMPSLASAQAYNSNVNGHSSVKIIDGPDRNKRPDTILIDGPDRNSRPDIVINVRDDERRDYYRYDDRRNNDRRWDDRRYDDRHFDYRKHDFYRVRHGYYNAPRNWGRNRCGFGTVSYRLPNGRMMYDNVYMCQTPRGDWVVANR